MESTKSSILKISKKVGSKIELAKAIVNITLAFGNIKLSETAINSLAYFMVYGLNAQTKELIIKSKICNNKYTMKRVMWQIKKIGLTYKDDLNNKVYLSQSLQIPLTPTVAMMIKMDMEVTE